MSHPSAIESAPDEEPTPRVGFRAKLAKLAPYGEVCRPREWVKNLFLLAPLLFGGKISDLSAIAAAAWACAGFCLLSSAVYSVNDVIDAEADRAHPRKRRRPVASGRASPGNVLAMAIVLAIAALGLMTMTGRVGVAICAGLYAGNSLLYVLVLKREAILDVLAIAIGFVLRLLAGCAAVAVDPSPWLLICGFSLALLLGFGKRRLELANVDPASRFRPALRAYSPEKLNLMLGVSASLCLLSYMLYAAARETVELHHTRDLIYTVPFVAYGVFRFLFQVQDAVENNEASAVADGPADILLRDPIFAINAALWVACSAAILYWP